LAVGSIPSRAASGVVDGGELQQVEDGGRLEGRQAGDSADAEDAAALQFNVNGAIEGVGDGIGSAGSVSSHRLSTF
jgi:hypothetical protein